MSRRVWVAALFTLGVLLVRPSPVPDIGWSWPEPYTAEALESDAIALAPPNATFNAQLPDAVRNSAEGRAGRVAPEGWQLSKGAVLTEKGGPSDDYAALREDETELISSPFTVRPTSKKGGFNYRFFQRGEGKNGLRVFVLSGANYDQRTEVALLTCACDRDWQKQFIDVEKWAGQNIRLMFVREKGSNGAVGIDDIAMDQLEARLGRGGRKSAKVADPIDTSNGNFKISDTDLVLPAVGADLSFSRTYNSNSTFNGTMGNGWTNIYSLGLTVETDGSVTVRYPDGNTANFTPGVGWVGLTTWDSSQFNYACECYVSGSAALRSDGVLYERAQNSPDWYQTTTLPGSGWVGLTTWASSQFNYACECYVSGSAALRSDGVLYERAQNSQDWYQTITLPGSGWVGSPPGPALNSITPASATSRVRRFAQRRRPL